MKTFLIVLFSGIGITVSGYILHDQYIKSIENKCKKYSKKICSTANQDWRICETGAYLECMEPFNDNDTN